MKEIKQKRNSRIAAILLIAFMIALSPFTAPMINYQPCYAIYSVTDDTTAAAVDVTLNLSILTDDNLFRIVGESGAASINIVIKDKTYSVVKTASISVTNGRFDWSESLSGYTAGETYKVYLTDNLGNTTNGQATIPAKADSYTLNLNALANGSFFTVAGESSCTSVSITIKSATYVTVLSTTAAVSSGRFELSRPTSNFSKGSSYYVTVKDTNGHSESQTVLVPEDPAKTTIDDYTLTILPTMKDGILKIVGESSESKVTVEILDDILKQVDKREILVRDKKYSWIKQLSDLEQDRVYKITATDDRNHKTSQDITIPIAVSGIEFGSDEKKLEVDKSLSLSAAVLPSGAQSQTITFKSSDSNIATVSASGKVTGKSPGKVTITASVRDISQTIELTVYIKTVKIQLNETYLVLLPNGTFQITADIIPKTASKDYKYISTNESVAVVTSEGAVTAIAKGVASIIVTNGSADGILTVVVNVTDDGTIGSWHSGSTLGATAEHLESSALSKLIEKSESKEVAISNTDLNLIDSPALLALKKEGKNLIIDKVTYIIRLKGKDVINPSNTLITEIPIEPADDNVKFIVNNEEPLPGNILIHLRDANIQKMKYLYLYNPVKNKYQKLDSFNTDDKSIRIDKGGTYLLTAEKLQSDYFNFKILATAGGVCLALGIAYVLLKRKYWFY